jgi:hypothetical protein
MDIWCEWWGNETALIQGGDDMKNKELQKALKDVAFFVGIAHSGDPAWNDAMQGCALLGKGIEELIKGRDEARLAATRLSLKYGDDEKRLIEAEETILNKESQIVDLERRLRDAMEKA